MTKKKKGFPLTSPLGVAFQIQGMSLWQTFSINPGTIQSDDISAQPFRKAMPLEVKYLERE